MEPQDEAIAFGIPGLTKPVVLGSLFVNLLLGFWLVVRPIVLRLLLWFRVERVENKQDTDEHQEEAPSSSIPKSGSISSSIQEEPQASQDPVGHHDQILLFPFVINGQSVPHIGDKVFQYLDQESLLKFRVVSTAHKTYVDTKTSLWKNKSLMEAVIDKDLDDTLRLQIIRKILERKSIEWTTIKQKILKAIEEDRPNKVLQLAKKFVDESDRSLRTPLHEAATRGQSEVCSAILNSHVHEANPPNTIGKTPLHEAAENGHTEIAQMIMDRVVEKNPPNHNGKTPLHCAAWWGHTEICRLIVDRVVEKNPPDHDGKTPLHCAARWGHTEICRLIMDNVEEKEPVDSLGYTPLMEAARNRMHNTETYDMIKNYLQLNQQ